MSAHEKFTPGPWVANGLSVNGAAGILVCRGYTNADVRLLAQAPALYAALKGLMENWGSGGTGAAMRAVEAARAALRDATE